MKGLVQRESSSELKDEEIPSLEDSSGNFLRTFKGSDRAIDEVAFVAELGSLNPRVSTNLF